MGPTPAVGGGLFAGMLGQGDIAGSAHRAGQQSRHALAVALIHALANRQTIAFTVSSPHGQSLARLLD